jgi:uncharacterized Zn finger protein (UPF0148 family)
MIFVVKCGKCPNCGMPLVDEVTCEYCEWTKNAK